jgi:hypothetical protein
VPLPVEVAVVLVPRSLKLPDAIIGPNTDIDAFFRIAFIRHMAARELEAKNVILHCAEVDCVAEVEGLEHLL